MTLDLTHILHGLLDSILPCDCRSYYNEFEEHNIQIPLSYLWVSDLVISRTCFSKTATCSMIPLVDISINQI